MSSDASQPIAVSDRFPLWMRSGAAGRVLLCFAAVISYALFHWSGNVFHIPTYSGYSISLLQQDSPFLAIVITTILFLVCVGVGTLIAGIVHVDAGMFAAAWGLIALSGRGGPMEYVLMRANGKGVYVMLALESLLLLAIVLLGWQVLCQILRRGWVSRELLPTAGEEDGIHQRLLAGIGQIVVMILCMTLLAQTDEKIQVLAAVGISAWAGTAASYVLFPTRPSIGYLAGPMVVAMIGYLFSYFGDEGQWIIGHAASSLSRPAPLDYAGAGIVGALIGYWMSRRWQDRRDEEAAGTTESTA